MRLLGYAKGVDAESPTALSEVTILAGPEALRRLAEFLLHASRTMEEHGDAFGHEHFADFAREFADGPSIVVAR